MAKTTTRPKPATSKKTEASGSTAPDGAADIRMIPLDQLEPSPLNVRKVAASASDDAELLASIRETGIKQNLVVHALSETRFRVRTNKRKRLAHIPITPALAEVIDTTPPGRLLILTNANGNALTPHRASEGVRQWRDKAKLSDELRLYDARGTAATRLLNAGLSLAEIANHMGWSVRYAANVIEHYARVSPDETDAVLVKLAQAKGDVA